MLRLPGNITPQGVKRGADRGLSGRRGTRLGGFDFNNRQYADDDLIVASVNPFELFLIFCELTSGEGPLPRGSGDVLGRHEILLDAYRTDVRPLCAKVRADLGAAEDPVGALRNSGYLTRIAQARGALHSIG